MSISERQEEAAMEEVSEIKTVKEGSTSGSPKRYPASFSQFWNDYQRRVEERKKKEKADTTPVTDIDKESGASKHPFTVFITEYLNENCNDKKPLSDVFLAGTAKWNSMSSYERAPYVDKSDLKYVEEQKEKEELEEARAYYMNRIKNRKR